MRNLSDLQARIAKGEQISQAEMAAKYDASAADYKKVVDWATSQGFTINRQDSHHLALFARGSISQIQKAMSLTFARVTFRNKEFTSAINPPTVPGWMSALVVGINGLQPHLGPHKHIIKKQNQPASFGGGGAEYEPKQIATAYTANTLYSSNITGAGQAIAIVIDTFPATSDLVAFWKQAGISQSLSNIEFIQAVSGQLAAPSGEETLDTEWSSSLAPGAHVRVYAATDLGDADLDATYLQVYDDVTNHPEYNIHQMSMSYGEGETYTTQSQVDTDGQYFAELTAAGVTIFASTGDEGSTPDANGGDTGPLNAESPASDPHVTAVGGTSLVLNFNNTESSEKVWNNGTGASSGGTSIYFDRPSWQTGTGVNLSAMRQIPDIALTADPNYGAVTYIDGAVSVVGGTSWSSPSCAAFCALINQARVSAGLSSVGLLGPQIYPLIGTSNFRDITAGNNATPNSGGKYVAGVGYDECTGIGAPLVQALSTQLVGSTGSTGVTPSVPLLEIPPGQNAAFEVTVSGSTATYQWQRKPIGSSTWTNLADGGAYSGSTTATLTITAATTAMSGDQFQCLVNLGSSIVTTSASVLVVATPLQVSTLAGQVGQTGTNNGSGTAAQFNYPSSVAIDSGGNIYVADFSNNQIREITPGGTVSTPYGNASGLSGSTNAAGNSARFNQPNSVAIDSANNIYVADTGNNLIRKISGGVVTTFAGTSNGFNGPEGVAVDSSGNVYVADTGNDVIRKISPGGQVSILAGENGNSGYADGAATTQALFSGPTAVAVDSLGNVYVADFGNSVVRKISAGVVSTVAGQAGQSGYLDGLGTNSLFNAPIGLAIDQANNVYIADSQVPSGSSNAAGNDVVRKLDTNGVVSTIAGNPGSTGSSDGTGTDAEFYSLQALAVNGGQFYLADTYNQTVRAAIFSGLTVAPVTLSNLAVTYNGSPQPVTATTSPSGLPVTITYNGSTTAPTNAGTYTVVATVNSTDYTGSATGTLVISKATATVNLSTPTAAYNGSAHGATATTVPAGLNVTISYNGMFTLPVDAGTYTVVATVNNANYTGTSSGTLVITGGVATVTFGNLTFTYNGAPHGATATTVPAGLPVTFTYDGSSTAPTAVGAYTVVATVNSPNYTGSATSTLNITPILPVATTAAATGITGTGATLNGTVNPEGSDTTVSFQYGTTTAYGTTTGTQDAGGGLAVVHFSTAITVAAQSTPVIYHYRAKAVNAGGTVYGADKTFTTLAAPAIATSPQAALGATGSEIKLTVNPDGVATSVYFQYGTTTGYGSTTAVQSLGSGKAAVNVFALLPGLSPSTLYHYRLVMTSAAGTFYGPDETFTTPSFDTQLVVAKGTAATGTTTTFASFGNPAVNVNDTVAFAGTLTLASGVTSANDMGIWTIDNTNTQTLVARIGSAAPGTGGDFLTLTDPVFNDSSAVAFKGTLKALAGQVTTTNATGVWSSSSGSLALVARQGSAAPGTSGTFATFTSLGLSESAGAVLFATLNAGTGITTANNSGIWEGNTTSDLALKLRLGQTVGGKTVTKLTFLPVETYVNGQTRGFNATGDLVSGATFSDKTTGIVTVVSGTPAVAEVSGTSATGIASANFATFGNPIINNSDKIAFAATVTGGGATTADNSGIWADDSTGTLQLIARTGSGIAPGTTAATFATFNDPVFNSHEAVAFRATLKGATTATETGIWCNSGGSLALVAQEGVTPAPGCPAGATFATFTELALPDQGGATNKGGVIFLGTLNANAAAGVTTTNNTGIWAVDSTGALQLIARTGDVVNVGTNKTITSLAFLPAETTVNGQTRSFDQTNGDIVYLATFSDKSTAILNVVF